MASATLYADFKGFLQDAVTGYSILDFDQLEPALEQGTDPLIVLEEDFATEELLALGNGGACQVETAYLTIHCFVPAPQSAAAARTIADQVRDAARFANFSDAHCSAVSPPDPARLNNGLWSGVSFSATLARHFHAAYPEPVLES